MARPHLHVDWDQAVRLAAGAGGEWILVAEEVSANALKTVKRRENLALREAGRIEAKMPTVSGSPERGDLWLRMLEDYRPPRVVGDSLYRPVRVSMKLKEQVFQRAQEKGVSVSELVDNALTRIARRGRRVEDPEAAVIAANVSTKKWERALRRADADGFTLAVALREELLYEARRRK